MRKYYKYIYLVLVFILVVPAVLSLVHAGFPLTDDGNWMVIRFSAFYESIRNGQIPVRFLMRLNNGYGYPIADFLYPLFMYISVPLHILGLNFVNAIKALLILCIFSSSLFSFLWLRKYFDNLSSLMGSVFYTLFPYYLFDIYKRGSVGEVLSLSVVPFVFWQIERRSIFWSATGIALLVLAHNTLALFFLPLIIIYGLLQIRTLKNKKETSIFYFRSIFLGLGMSAFFWLPAFYDLQYTVFSKTQVSDWRNYFSNFNLIGVSFLLSVLLTIYSIYGRNLETKTKNFTLLFLSVGLVSVFFSISLSSVFWGFLPVSFIQFPFRLLSLSALCGSFILAASLSGFKGRKKLVLGIFSLILIFFSASPFLSASSYQYLPDTFYSTNQDTTTVKNEYMPKWVKNIPSSMYTAKVENLTGAEKINVSEITPNKTVFQVFLTVPRTIRVNTIYFPGWIATVNGKQEIISSDNPGGLIQLNLNKGQNYVSLIFKETGVRVFSDLLALLSLIVLLFLVVRKRVFGNN